MLKRILSITVVFISSLIIALIILGIVLFTIDQLEGKAVTDKFLREMSQIPEMSLQQDPWWDKIELHVWSIISGKGYAIFWYRGDGSVSGILQMGNYFPDVDCVENSTGTSYSTFFNIGQGHNLTHVFPFEINTVRDIVDQYDQLTQTFSTLPHKPLPATTFTSVYKDQSSTCTLYIGKTSN